MMRVLMLSKACLVGIYQRKLERIACHDVDLLAVVPPSWQDERGEIVLERVYTEGYRLETLPLRFNGHFHLHHYVGLGRCMEAFRPQIVHIDEEPYNVATWQALYHARRLGAKTLFFSWQNINRAYPPPFSIGETRVLQNVDYAIAGTQDAADVWRAKGYSGPMAVIPQFGIDPDLFAPPGTSPPEKPFTIGFSGRLVEEKGAHLLLDAATRLPGEWHLHILGGGPQRGELEALAARLSIADRVTFFGQIPSTDTPGFYHRLHALALPSLTRRNWKEQFGRVLVEAMASGVPVVGSDSGAIPGVIGDAGLVVPEGDVIVLADALARLQHDAALRRELAEKGRARVLAHYTHEQVAKATVAVYQSLLAG
jgi:glycosyltransferase involved in cell wall biosynthesis